MRVKGDFLLFIGLKKKLTHHLILLKNQRSAQPLKL